MADKKKIAFVANCCIVGGVETALINLLNVFDTDRYDVTLYTNFAGNPVVHSIPSNIRCIDIDKYNIRTCFHSAIKGHKYLDAARIAKNYIMFKFFRNAYQKSTLLYDHVNVSIEKYDCVICFKQGILTLCIAEKLVDSNKKVLWIHGEMPCIDEKYLRMLSSYDKYICVSRFVRTHFVDHCKNAGYKAIMMHNIVNSRSIYEKSNDSITKEIQEKKYIFATVGRLGNGKGQDIIPDIAKLLSEKGIEFIWYIIGDGIERQNIEREIKRTGTEENVILLGEKSNPYPYMKKCSIYVQTSLTEGWCLTTQEARILHKPCVVTDIPVMHEQFTDGVNGIIANGTDANALFEGIMRLICSPELTKQIVANLKAVPQDGVNEIQKLYDYIES